MFYDEAFGRITAITAFAEDAVLSIGNEIYNLRGFFCSGHYGDKKLDKGYTTNKAVKKQSFQMAKVNLPSTIDIPDITRQKLTVRGQDFIVREVTGNDSGILVFDLVPSGSAS